MTTTTTSELLDVAVSGPLPPATHYELADLAARLDAALAQNAAMRKALEWASKNLRHHAMCPGGYACDCGLEANVLSVLSSSPPVDPLALLGAEDRETLHEACNDAAVMLEREISMLASPIKIESYRAWLARYAAMRERLAKGGAE